MADHGLDDLLIHDVVAIEGFDVVTDLVGLQGEERNVVKGLINILVVENLTVHQDFVHFIILFLLYDCIYHLIIFFVIDGIPIDFIVCV